MCSSSIVRHCHTTRYDLNVVDVTELLWDDHNQAHIARHDVTAAEVTSLIFGPGPLLVVISDEHRVAGASSTDVRKVGGTCWRSPTHRPRLGWRMSSPPARPLSDRERRAFEERVKNDG